MPAQPHPAAPDAPLAVVGLSCRFPGADSPAAFWRLLLDGADTVGPPPAWRAEGRSEGGYLDGVDLFDAELFGVPPQEAAAMDPQQRLLLELAWEALEDARTAPDALAGTSTGVFVGAGGDDYAHLTRTRGTADIGVYTMTGTGRAFLANRISYTLGLRGPSMVVDTGQSSSLTALHQAAAGLRRGECVLALVGGVQLNLSAESEEAVRQLGALSPSGRCRTFDAAADGIVRGEGGGMAVLKPLDTALADGDRVYCVLRGSAVNSDGRGESLTAPDAGAQRQVLAEACRRAGVAPTEVAYVELHGTGTRLGDPVEAAALDAVHGQGRPAGRPLLVGSVKTNIGHLEAAAGMAAFVKTALSVHHGLIPPSLHLRTPNPAVDPARLRVCQDVTPWPAHPEGRRTAGISSFGLGGTNCHVVVDRVPGTVDPAADEPGPPPVACWVLSGASEAALRGQAARLAGLLEASAPPGPADAAFSLATTRAVLRHRAAVVGDGPEALRDRLRALATGEPREGVLQGAAGRGGTAFLFPGQGMQRAGMGRRLHETYPVFARAFDEAAEAMETPLGTRLHTLMWEREDWLDELRYAQPALFAMETALYRLLESWGLVPDLVLGHSQGEIAAAHVAGVLSLEDAAAFVVERGRLIASLPPGGAMTALRATEEEARAVLAGICGQVAIAAVNSPRSVVISGDREAVDEVCAHFARLGRRGRRLRISRAGHSPLMEPVRDELLAFAGSLTWKPPTGPTVVSTLTGHPATGTDLVTPAYWAEHLCRAVRFGDAVRTAHDRGARFFVEAGPGHGLITMVGETVDGGDETLVAPLAEPDERAGVASLAGHAHLRGLRLDAHAVHGAHARRTDLPTYAFQRRRHWLDAPTGPARTPSPAPPPGTPAAPPRRRVTPATVSALVADGLRGVLGAPQDSPVETSLAFTDLGLDSRMVMALRTRLAERTGLRLPPTLLFDFPTPDLLSRELAERLRSQRPHVDLTERPS
ncbi:type I polyketide synthase [Streptomyces sp. NPDC059218]|uniref:type I polyketide synthase n=1 Tax=unclassified Streptomyces TaxID=2593676 RepID=UPI0036736E4B